MYGGGTSELCFFINHINNQNYENYYIDPCFYCDNDLLFTE